MRKDLLHLEVDEVDDSSDQPQLRYLDDVIANLLADPREAERLQRLIDRAESAPIQHPQALWESLQAVEPRLAALQRELASRAKAEELSDDWREYEVQKRRLKSLVGYWAERSDLPDWATTSTAWDVAHRNTLGCIW